MEEDGVRVYIDLELISSFLTQRQLIVSILETAEKEGCLHRQHTYTLGKVSERKKYGKSFTGQLISQVPVSNEDVRRPGTPVAPGSNQWPCMHMAVSEEANRSKRGKA